MKFINGELLPPEPLGYTHLTPALKQRQYADIIRALADAAGPQGD